MLKSLSVLLRLLGLPIYTRTTIFSRRTPQKGKLDNNTDPPPPYTHINMCIIYDHCDHVYTTYDRGLPQSRQTKGSHYFLSELARDAPAEGEAG